MPFDDLLEGKTHSYNDGCGEPAHNNVYNLIDYKGKYTIIQDMDMLSDFDDPVGSISHENAIKEAPERFKASLYYGIPAYIGKNKELLEIFKKLYESSI